MHKETREQITRTRITHTFYCDMCGEEIGTSTEYEDGYYQQLGEYETHIYIDHTRYTLNKCLCRKCVIKQNEMMVANLKNLGFKEDW